MKISIGQKEFNFLLDKFKKLKDGERSIRLSDKLLLIFRYCVVKVDGILDEELKFPILNPKTDNEKVISLVFDAKGLHKDFITEIEVFKENKTYIMYIVPQRDDGEIDSFRKLLNA